jgi:hypothetical protein
MITTKKESPVPTPHEMPPITEADVTAFSERLTAWAQELPAGEAAVLAALLHRAFPLPDDNTNGFAYFPDQAPVKHLAGLKVDDISFTMGRGMSASLYDWIEAGFGQRRRNDR